jgi:hypothetical protein
VTITGPTKVSDPYDYIHWEVIGPGDAAMCPDCITGEEQQAIDEDAMDLAAQMGSCARCGRSWEVAADSHQWELVGEEHFCPGCLTADEHARVVSQDLAAAENLRLTWGSKDRLN